jgi:DNA primase
MISPESVDRIINAARIEEVVSDYVKLRKRGINLLGLCPFHNEKTPSFTVSPVKGIFKCFGCGKSGNSVGFIMEHEHMTYPEALRYLAGKYHIDIEESAPDPALQQQQSERESQYILLAAAQKFFADQLWNTEEGKTIGLSYFKERDLSNKTIEEFGLGWGPIDRQALTAWAEKNSYSKELLIKTGLSVEGREGQYFDRFHERVMFPIHNLSGKVIGFGGRIIRSNDKVAKYINSPETEIYNKSKSVYGMFQAKKAIRQQDSAILVEGYMDVLSMHQAGLENVVASSGTSLTEDQLGMIKRFTDNVIFLFDGDEAGKKASVRALDMALGLEMNPRVVTLPAEHDPDSFARAHDQDYIQDYLQKEGKDFLFFRLSLLTPEQREDPLKKAAAARELLEAILLLKDNLKRAFYIKEIEKALGLDERFLYEELRRMQIGNYRKELQENKDQIPMPLPPMPQQPVQDYRPVKQERHIIKLLLQFGKNEWMGEQPVAEHILAELEEIELEDEDCRKILEYYLEMYNNGIVPEPAHFLNTEDTKLQQTVINLLEEKHVLNERWTEFIGRPIPGPEDNYRSEVRFSLLHLKLRKIQQLILENQKQLKSAPEEEVEVLLLVKRELDALKQQIGKELGAIIL